MFLLRIIPVMLVVFSGVAGLAADGGSSDGNDIFITLATTTSTENSGLLNYLHPVFTGDTGIDVRVIARGTGAALKIARNGDADVVIVHSRSAEDQFIKDGFGTQRLAMMHNDFVLLGPAEDPAGVKGVDILEALAAIDATNSVFISRGDNSGTHNKEVTLWERAGLKGECGKWLLSVGQGMGKTLSIASEKKAYTLSDRGTYLAMKKQLELVLLSEGSEFLNNPYAIIPVNPEKHPHVKTELVKKYVDWLRSQKGQSLIEGFRVDGDELFHPDVLCPAKDRN